MKFRVPEIFLGCFLTIAVFAMGFVFSSSYHPPQSTEQSQPHSADDHKRSKEATEERLADYTWWLALLTGALAVSTVGLWVATGIGVRVQIKDTRILQRAYLSVNPLGVARFTSGQAFFSCDVGFQNVGNLPAKNVRWFIDRMFADDRWLKEFPIKEDGFEGKNIIAPGIEMRKGTTAIESQSFYAARNRGGVGWLYVWGEIRYDDGFGSDRFTKFCFRYNMAGASPDLTKEGIPKENARYHAYGNDAD
jgi:hypothetical protein